MILSDDVLKVFLNYLKLGDFFKIKTVFEQIGINNLTEKFKSVLNVDLKKKIEDYFHKGLRICIKNLNFDNFRELSELSNIFDIFIDVQKIEDRFEILSEHLINCIEEVATGYQTSSLGKVIKILDFFNQYNLLERELSKNDLKEIENLRKDKLLICNLKDLFGKVSNSLIFYVHKIIPKDLYEYFITDQNIYYMSSDQLAYYIKNIFFNQYSIYGLSVKYLGTVKAFIKEFNKNISLFQSKENHFNIDLSNHYKNLIEFNIKYRYKSYFFGLEEERESTDVKKHCVSPNNITNNINKILDKNNYNFYSLSMVLLGGIGPQGHAFTYSTPKGELIEICSDIRENEAIIVRYKEFLKRRFLAKLEKKLSSMKIKKAIIETIIEVLSDFLFSDEKISYFKKGRILNIVRKNLSGLEKITYILEKISNAIDTILRPIEMLDQFRCRMELVDEGKLKSEDIAKLTSLKNKSHYDILRERFFYQYIVDWFYEIYKTRGLGIDFEFHKR